jgi:hypothetical protein
MRNDINILDTGKKVKALAKPCLERLPQGKGSAKKSPLTNGNAMLNRYYSPPTPLAGGW